jgi:XRE family aerobic/anaerobic benzoate catabolism transcriptional regulator
MDDLLARVGAEVRSLRVARGLSLRGLADKSGLSERFLRDVEAGRANISIVRFAHLAEALGRSAPSIWAAAEAARKLLVSLLGLRGAGKSTVGPRLAARLGVPFFELDALIESRAGLSLGEIFAVHGEPYYRRLEMEALDELLDRHDAGVIATGGGIVHHAEAMQRLRERTTTVWLRADPDDHWKRVVRQGDTRPMAGSPEARSELRRILAEREPLYARARHQVDTSRLGIKRSVDALVKALGGAPGN